MRAGQGLILCVLGLLTIGVIMVASAALTVDADPPITLEGVLLGRNMLYALLAVGALVLGASLPVERIFTLRGLASPIPWLVLAMVLLLLAVHVPGLGRTANGATRWLNFGSLSFQPSEFAKWALPIVVAWHCCRRADAMGSFRTGFVPPIALAAIVCLLIAMEDLGTGVLVFTVCCAMLFAAGCRLHHLATMALPALAGIGALVAISPYRIDRLLAYRDPYVDPRGIGYHVIQSMSAVAGGGIGGRGLGNSVQKFDYLPEDTTDFIFAIICEELGLAGALVVTGLYAALLLVGLAIILRTPRPFSRLLGLGILLTIGLQAAMNLAVVTGLAPTKGIALPLLSRGGSGWLLTALAVGLLVAIDRATAEETPAEALGSDEPGAEDDHERAPAGAVPGGAA